MDPKGEMLEQKWEEYSTMLANSTSNKLMVNIETIIRNEGIDYTQYCRILVAMDTRQY